MSGTPRRSDSLCLKTKWAHFTLRTSLATPGTPHSSVLGHRHRRRGLLAPQRSDIASDAGDSSVLGHRQRRRGLLAPRCSIIAIDAGASTVLPWWSHLATSRRCAIKLLHAVQIRVLILGSTSGVLIRACRTTSAKLSDFFFFDPATRFILYLLAGLGTKWAHFTLQ